MAVRFDKVEADLCIRLLLVDPFKPFDGLFDLVAPAYQHKFSVHEDSGRDKIRQSVLDVFFLKMSGDKKRWALINPTAIIDYEQHAEFVLIDVEIGTMLDDYLGTKGHSIYLRPSVVVGADRPADGSIEIGYKIVW